MDKWLEKMQGAPNTIILLNNSRGDIGAPIFTSANSLLRLAYFHTNRLLAGLYKTETEIRWRKDDNKVKKQQTLIVQSETIYEQ
jgi:hypothetical protein